MELVRYFILGPKVLAHWIEPNAWFGRGVSDEQPIRNLLLSTFQKNSPKNMIWRVFFWKYLTFIIISELNLIRTTKNKDTSKINFGIAVTKENSIIKWPIREVNQVDANVNFYNEKDLEIDFVDLALGKNHVIIAYNYQAKWFHTIFFWKINVRVIQI